MGEQGTAADQIDTGRPHPARMYDYFLGGHDNYEVDRDAAEEVIARVPFTRTAARANRAFLARAIPFVVNLGIRQIIDIGTGIPTSPNTHELAQAVDPLARIAYVDNDPIVGAHANALLTSSGETTFVLADVRDPQSILQNPKIRNLIDFGEPVAVLLVNVLHFVTDLEDPAGIVATLRDALPDGSALVLTQGTSDTEEARVVTNLYRNASSSLSLRSHAEITRFFSGFELVDPGVVSVAEWRPDRPVTESVGHLRLCGYGGVGLLRSR